MRRFSFLSQLVLFFLFFLISIMAITQPDIIADAAGASLEYAYLQVIPVMFPFLVFASLLAGSSISVFIGAVFYPFTRYFLKIRSIKAGTVVAVALQGGFAAAATMLHGLYTQKNISADEANRLLPLIFMPSVPFIVFIVGGEILNNIFLGMLIAVSIIASTFVTAGFCSLFVKKELKPDIPIKKDEIPLHTLIVTSIQKSANNMLYITGFIVFFGVVSEMLYALLPEKTAMVISFLLEFSTSVNKIGLKGNIYYITAALSLVGCSAFFQIKAITQDTINLSIIFKSRILHLPLSLIFLKILLLIFPTAVQVMQSVDEAYIVPFRFGGEFSVVIYLLIIAVFSQR